MYNNHVKCNRQQNIDNKVRIDRQYKIMRNVSRNVECNGAETAAKTANKINSRVNNLPLAQWVKDTEQDDQYGVC